MNQKIHTIDLLNLSFETTEGDEILQGMKNSHQFYILHRHRVASMLSVKKNALARTGKRVPFMIYNACTHPRFQNRGFMSQLLLHVVATLASEGNASYLYLEVLKKNTPAIRLYRKLGFRSCQDFGEGILMKKRLLS
jgi:ribosomal protein S18 acetylase RimI-like enzyme